MYKILITFITALSANYVFAQNIKIFNHTNSVLPDNEISRVIIDKDKVWIGTKGIFVYDGKAISPYNNPAVNSHKLDLLFKDKKGSIWFSYNYKNYRLACFDGKSWKLFSSNTNGITINDVHCATEDGNGKLYFGSIQGIVTYNGKTWERFSLPKESIYQYTIRSIAVNPNGDIAIGLNSGLFLYHNKQFKLLNSDNSELQLDVVMAVKYAPDGSLYIGYNGGLGKGGFSILKNDRWTHFNTSNSKLPDQTVRGFEFAENDTWLATNSGLIKLHNKQWSLKKFTSSRWEAILGMAVNKDGTMLIAEPEGFISFKE
ncbi:hypothetical protein ACFQZI_03970 [Mucilaginibacter lutimaris]|uniref:Two component regulator propeller n=1 Tax=Mucilaginibacter lutimaris TaxID=931629 RepID=A0ABW2ZCU4_9SPHI